MEKKKYIAPAIRRQELETGELMLETSLLIDPDKTVDTVGSNEMDIWEETLNNSKGVWDE